ncbi:TetR/AcrR family transcriptional regulator [Rhabdothermincola salaria]|uniref:TetR/AcrR family transcriptional regulator n=1 Tax=Rhabdothermincola salaria TaxID=2903142 RepID=UPI001E4BC8AE|nr:TetR/AcrR family transcriptional regulator [Rhabdothermincola salaria]MCD9625133.1 TetR/AcrR family transcriptional regulator [Rhabdothermincola salaria]
MNARLPAAERRHQLLATALATFAERGYHQASMNDIADAAGVTKPVLYQHFGSKRELFLEVLREVGGELRQRVREATIGAPSPHQQVLRGFEAWFRWVDEQRDGFAVLFDGEVRRDAEFLAEASKVQRQIADLIADLIAVDGLSEERRRLLAYGIVGLGESTCRRWLAKEIQLDADHLAAQVAELAWAGLRGLRPE